MDIISLPNELERYLSRINNEKELQRSINSLAIEGREVAKSFLGLIESKGRSIIQKDIMLSFIQDLHKVDVQSYGQSVIEFNEGLSSVKHKLIMLQKMVHQNVEICRGKKQKYERDVREKREQLKYIDERVQKADQSIAEYENTASAYEREAKNLKASSDESMKDSVLVAGSGIFTGALGLGIGAALAPFTGGTSLLVGGIVAGGSVGGHAVAVGVNIAKALDLGEKAERARSRANTARRERMECIDEKNFLLSDIRPLQINIDKTRLQVESLESLETFLYRCVNSIDLFQKNAQSKWSILATSVSGLSIAGAEQGSHRSTSKIMWLK